MRHVARDFLHARHQPLDAVEHLVERLGQAVELVARSRHRHAALHIAAHDGPARVGDGIDAAQEIAAHQQAATKAKHQGDADGADKSAADDAGKLAQRLDVAPDDQFIVAGEIGVKGARLVALGAAAVLYIERKFDPVRIAYRLGRQFVDVAGDPVAHRIGQEIDRSGLLAAAAL